jgi:hypothetical protein
VAKIIIAGDSYGLGEWGIGTRVTHPGINQYFREWGYNVINCAGPGYSLEESFWSLRDCMSNCYQTEDIVLWIQTDPSRSIDHSTLAQDLKSNNGLNPLLYDILDKNYADINDLGKQHDTLIHAIGGLFDLRCDKTYSNLHFLIKSWMALLMQDRHPTYFEKHFGIVKSVDIKQIALEQFDHALAQKVVVELGQWSQNDQILDQNRHIFTDGFHPSRQGHRILFEHLITTLNLAKLHTEFAQTD